MSNSKFKTKVRDVDAMQLTETNAMDVFGWITTFFTEDNPMPPQMVNIYPTTGTINIMTPGGVLTANPGDWVVHSDVGGFEVAYDDVFTATYEDNTPAP